jgi:large repetitive protein
MSGSDLDIGDTLVYTVGMMPTNGTLTSFGNGNFSYTPSLGFSGADSFSFTIFDGSTTSSTGVISITVNPNTINQSPVASSASHTTSEDILLIAPLIASDPEGAILTYSVLSGVTNGLLSLTSTGLFTYTPTANYSGTDSFTYRVSD